LNEQKILVLPMFGVRPLFFALLISLCLGHGTIVKPAMRANPTISSGWCPWCQGDQAECAQPFCTAPSPCWGAPGPTTVGVSRFSGYTGLKDSNGEYWIDQTDGNDTRPIYCPGETFHYSVLLTADHNGIHQFQTMQGKPGSEKEQLFKPISGWKTINNEDDITYYLIDGITPQKPGTCKSGVAWKPEIGHCRDDTLYKDSITLPANLPPGDTILRWVWYGGMTVDGKKVIGPEHSLFVNCKDIIIGTPQQCGK